MLVRAVMAADREEIVRLIELGASPDEPNECDMTPLLLAIEHGLLNSVQALVGGGASLDTQNYRGMSPLHLAVDNSIDETVQEGGELGSEPTEIIEFLVEHGANVYLTDNRGKTPLDWARNRSSKIVDILQKATKRS